MSSIQYTAESLELWLQEPSRKELADRILSDIEYLATQYGRSKQKRFLLLNTTKSIIERINEVDAIPADIDDQPF